jgi:hypothetical protein
MNTRHALLTLLVVACGGGAQNESKTPATTSGATEPAPATTAVAAASDAKAATPAASVTAAPAAEAPITSVRVYVSNECDKPVNYCVDDGSTLNTSLSQRTSTTHTVKPGARILEKTGSSCGAAKFTVPASKDEVKFSICKK